jgi:hypothetical protein
MSQNMDNYTFPDLSNHKIIYKGRRYIAFEVSQTNPFESMEDDAAVSYEVVKIRNSLPYHCCFEFVRV